MLPRQNVLYENEPKRNVTIRKLTIKNFTDRFTKNGFSLYRCYLEFFFDGFYYVKGTVGVISESTCINKNIRIPQ